MSTEIRNPNKITEQHGEAETAAFARDLQTETTNASNIRTAKETVMKWSPIGRQSEPSVSVQFRVPKSWKVRIKQDAVKQGMNVSEYMRSLVVDRHRELQSA